MDVTELGISSCGDEVTDAGLTVAWVVAAGLTVTWVIDAGLTVAWV